MRTSRVSARTEFLEPAPVERLGDEQVALGIDGEAVRRLELTAPTPAAAERRYDLERVAPQRVHTVVAAVGEVDVGLRRIGRERDIPRRAAHLAVGELRVHERVLDERPVLAENLNPLVAAIADVDLAVVGDGDA